MIWFFLGLVLATTVVRHGKQSGWSVFFAEACVHKASMTLRLFLFQATPVGDDSPKPASRSKVSMKGLETHFEIDYEVTYAVLVHRSKCHWYGKSNGGFGEF